MAQLLLVGDEAQVEGFGQILSRAGHEVLTAASGECALSVLERRSFDLVVSELRLHDVTGLQLLQQLRRRNSVVPFVVTGLATIREAVAAMRLGATDVVETPIIAERLLRTVGAALQSAVDGGQAKSANERLIEEAHAAARWARALAPVIASARDPRTITSWSRLIFASPGALRNWCRTAGVSPRRSLVFGRLLRVARLSKVGRHRPEDLLDIVDRRTLVGLLKCAGLNPDRPFPSGVAEFLDQQRLIRDPDRLCELSRAISASQSAIAVDARSVAARTATR
jgi:FixJ family two-component response regulator